jgi:hypothetical protein
VVAGDDDAAEPNIVAVVNGRPGSVEHIGQSRPQLAKVRESPVDFLEMGIEDGENLPAGRNAAPS